MQQSYNKCSHIMYHSDIQRQLCLTPCLCSQVPQLLVLHLDQVLEVPCDILEKRPRASRASRAARASRASGFVFASRPRPCLAPAARAHLAAPMRHFRLLHVSMSQGLALAKCAPGKSDLESRHKAQASSLAALAQLSLLPSHLELSEIARRPRRESLKDSCCIASQVSKGPAPMVALGVCRLVKASLEILRHCSESDFRTMHPKSPLRPG